MSTTTTLPDWLVDRVPASTIATATVLAAELDAITDRLGPLVLQLRGLVEIRDRIIGLRLADDDHSIFVDGSTATTTEKGHEVVLEALTACDAAFPAFVALDRLTALLEAAEAPGLSWDWCKKKR